MARDLCPYERHPKTAKVNAVSKSEAWWYADLGKAIRIQLKPEGFDHHEIIIPYRQLREFVLRSEGKKP